MPISDKVIRIGHSPDADDAFMFFGFQQGIANIEGYQIEHVINDIQTLNQLALLDDPLEVTALSLASFLKNDARYELLEVGTSVGRRYGPRLVATQPITVNQLAGKRIALPGRGTTAALMAKHMLPPFEAVFVDFDDVFACLERGEADAGVIIHEGQLNYGELGFHLVMDFGEEFFQRHALPLPLGVNCVRKDLPAALKKAIQTAYLLSIQYALENKNAAIDYALQYGRGMTPEQAGTFIGMYVNEDSLQLSGDLQEAIAIIKEQYV